MEYSARPPVSGLAVGFTVEPVPVTPGLSCMTLVDRSRPMRKNWMRRGSAW